MKLGIDVDGILADFNTAYVARIKAITGRNLFADPPVFNCWHYAEALGYTPRELRLVWDDIKADDAFWRSLKPYDDISESMSGLRWRHACGDDIYFITARPGATTKRQTEQWLLARQNYLVPFGPTVLMSGDKGACCAALKLDYYLDDKFENAVDAAVPWGYDPKDGSTKSYLLTRPWNVQFCLPPEVKRVASMGEFFAVLP